MNRYPAVLTAILISILLSVLLKSRSYDDPYITYRYAENLRHGAGFVYNPGERIQSTTTPFFTLLLAGLSFLWGDLPHLANLIGAASLAAGGLLLWGLADFWKAPWAGWVGLLLYPTFPLAITPLGSETPLYIALCLGAIVAYLHKRYQVTAVCAALAALTRPDGLLVGFVLGGCFLWRTIQAKRGKSVWIAPQAAPAIPWKAVILFFVLLIPWFLFAWGYFGSPLPVTLAAKQNQGAMALSQRFTQGFFTTLSWYTSWRYVLEAVLSLLGLAIILRKARHWFLFFTWPAMYFLSFSLLGVSRYFWYYTPLVPGFLLLCGLGVQGIAESGWQWMPGYQRLLGSFKRNFPNLNFRLGSFFSILILIVLVVNQARGLIRLRQPDTRYAIYRAAGEWLASHTPVDTTVGSLEVGILGYYARRPMVDFAGLIQPEVAAQLSGSSSYESAALWAAEHYQPRFLAIFMGDFPQLEQGTVAQRCRLDVVFQGSYYAYGKDLAIYECQ